MENFRNLMQLYVVNEEAQVSWKRHDVNEWPMRRFILICV